jgi:hypothetical protein
MGFHSWHCHIPCDSRGSAGLQGDIVAMERLMPETQRNVRRGIVWGACYAAVYSVFVLILAAVVGNRPFAHSQTSLGKVLLLYWLGGIGVGALIGALLKLGGTKLGAAFLGILGALPIMFGAGMATSPRSEWFTTVPTDAVISACVLGPLCGLGLWWVNRW